MMFFFLKKEIIYALLIIFMKNEIDYFKDKNSCLICAFITKKGLFNIKFPTRKDYYVILFYASYVIDQYIH